VSAALAAEIAALTAKLGVNALEKACAILESAPAGSTALVVLRRHEHEFAPWAAEALQRVAGGGASPHALALALRCAAAAQQAAHLARGEVELLWSGPEVDLPGIRSIEQALRDLILSARKELWLVSFAAYRIPHLLAALREVASRGVRIHFVLETIADSQGQLTAEASAAFANTAAAFYSWPLAQRPRNQANRSAKLHAKLAVADGATAIVSSANLTADALERNLECGILLRGGEIPGRLIALLNRLAARDILVVAGPTPAPVTPPAAGG
jgi:phosphatidylserine/phosphatidylglycerophosphate/cardiolipin synthase-like enzyme